MNVYYGIKDQRNANQQYYFKWENFEKIHGKLKGSFICFFATHCGKTVPSNLVFVSDEKIFSSLSVMDCEVIHLRPNDLLKYGIIFWANFFPQYRVNEYIL